MYFGVDVVQRNLYCYSK